MAVEIAGTCLHCSQPPLLRGPLSAKTVALAISSLLHSPSTISHHRTLFLGTALLHYSHQTGIAIIAGRSRKPLSSSIAALGSCENNHEDDQFAIESQTDHYAKTIHSTHANSDSDSDSPPSSSSSPGIDAFALQEMERRASRSDLPLSLRILKRKKKRRESSSSSSSSSSVKKAFSSMVLIVRELQSQVIRMRQALFSSDPRLRIHNTLARVHSELHASFVWLFHRIFSSTPTLMISLMLLLANFTLFSITDHYSFAFAAAAAPLPPTQSAPEESPTAPRFINPSALKSFSACRSAAVGGGGDGSGKPPAIAGAAGDGCSDRPPSSSGRGGTISVEEISMAASAWRRMVEETEAMRACERHEVLLDPDTLRRFVSPVTAEVEPDDLSGYAATELSYRVALAENPEDALLLCNFAQFLFSVLRDHDRAEEYFKRAIRAEPSDAETLSRYANFLWVARKDLGAAEETFLEAISADPGNSYYSANYAHFLWSTGGEDTCYPLGDCDT